MAGKRRGGVYSLLGLYIFAFVIAIQTWISYIRCIRYVYPSPPVPGGGGEASTPLPLCPEAVVLNRTAVAKEYADFRLFAGFDNSKSVLRIRIRRISIILPDTDPYFFHEFGSRSDPRP